jgi:hypothetical protein
MQEVPNRAECIRRSRPPLNDGTGTFIHVRWRWKYHVVGRFIQSFDVTLRHRTAPICHMLFVRPRLHPEHQPRGLRSHQKQRLLGTRVVTYCGIDSRRLSPATLLHISSRRFGNFIRQCPGQLRALTSSLSHNLIRTYLRSSRHGCRLQCAAMKKDFFHEDSNSTKRTPWRTECDQIPINGLTSGPLPRIGQRSSSANNEVFMTAASRSSSDLDCWPRYSSLFNVHYGILVILTD